MKRIFAFILILSLICPLRCLADTVSNGQPISHDFSTYTDVKKFEKDYGLTEDGILSPEDQEVLLGAGDGLK